MRICADFWVSTRPLFCWTKNDLVDYDTSQIRKEESCESGNILRNALYFSELARAINDVCAEENLKTISLR